MYSDDLHSPFIRLPDAALGDVLGLFSSTPQVVFVARGLMTVYTMYNVHTGGKIRRETKGVHIRSLVEEEKGI